MHNWSYASRYGRTAAVFVVDLVEGQDLSESYVRDYSASNSATALSKFVGEPDRKIQLPRSPAAAIARRSGGYASRIYSNQRVMLLTAQ